MSVKLFVRKIFFFFFYAVNNLQIWMVIDKGKSTHCLNTADSVYDNMISYINNAA